MSYSARLYSLYVRLVRFTQTSTSLHSSISSIPPLFSHPSFTPLSSSLTRIPLSSYPHPTSPFLSLPLRAVVVDGQVVARPMMYLALTYDHRLVDGREAVTFLKSIQSKIEDPTRLLLEL